MITSHLEYHSKTSYYSFMDLFNAPSLQNKEQQPLAYRMSPHTLDEYVGQEHIIGEGRLLRRMIQADQLSSLIFYGPPGTGKTALARVIAHTTKGIFITMNAVLSGVKTLREEIDKARERFLLHQKKTILFIDEIHRWNKAQQDALLPSVENGTIILIGATTENPYFEVNAALVSRSRIFQLKPLTKENLFTIAAVAFSDPLRGYGNYRIEFERGALEHLVDIANGDARSLLNAIQLAVETTGEIFPPKNDGQKIYIPLKTAEESIQKKVILYDRDGDYHFDIISAFIKSIRGSDPDAVLYWLAKMIRAGEDPRFIFRRMLISASEDVGLADPGALGIVTAAATAFDRVGMPEGRFHLTQAALYLATAPKSNSALGFFDALKTVETEEPATVPNHLRDGGRDKEGFGHGKGYLYPHAYHNHWVPQQYLPDSLKGKVFYHPSSTGYEGTLKDDILKRREVMREMAAPLFPEILTTTPGKTERDRLLQRFHIKKTVILEAMRNNIFSRSLVSPHHRILVLNDPTGFLLWEACRQSPEGIVYALPGVKQFDNSDYTTLIQHAEKLPELERPVIINKTLQDFKPSPGILFERILGRNVLTRIPDRIGYLQLLKEYGSADGRLILAETVPSASTRLSALLQNTPQDVKILKEAEKIIFESDNIPLTNWTVKDITPWFNDAGYKKTKIEKKIYREKRFITKQDIENWMNEQKNQTGYGFVLREIASPRRISQLKEVLIQQIADKSFLWEFTVVFIQTEIHQ